MRKKILAGNWKMNLLHSEAKHLVNELNQKENLKKTSIEVILFPSSVYLQTVKEIANFSVGIQNISNKSLGAYTGEVAAEQANSMGAKYVLVGHSERREYFNEGDELLKEKVDAALRNELKVVFCCGEPLEIRQNGDPIKFVSKQIENSLFHLEAVAFDNIIIAYEPIWAIGTGLTASSTQAEEIHAAIRQLLSEKFGENVANAISILYGGSCNEKNAEELFACPNVDGGLIGGAALKSESFDRIAYYL